MYPKSGKQSLVPSREALQMFVKCRLFSNTLTINPVGVLRVYQAPEAMVLWCLGMLCLFSPC